MIAFVSFHPWARTNRPLVFGHRGGSRLAPENTIAAFDRGVAEGLDGLELDVRLTRDGEVVACHDASLDRTCETGGVIAEMMWSEVARVDAGYRFTPGDGTHPFRGRGVRVPALREVLARYPDRRMIVEMKDPGPKVAAATLAVIREANAVDRVCLGSFHIGALRAARRLEPAIATSASRDEVFRAMIWSRLGWLSPFRRYDAFQVPEVRESVRVVTPRFVRAAHRAQVPVQVWIVDGADEIRRLLEWGVDAIITDRPDVAVPAVRAWAGAGRAEPATRSSAGRS
jgi:glycerophosphoryl diester phosphodiesterase